MAERRCVSELLCQRVTALDLALAASALTTARPLSVVRVCTRRSTPHLITPFKWEKLAQVRETSRASVWKPSTWQLFSGGAKSSEQVKRDFSDIILQDSLHSNVRLIAASAANTKLHGAPFRHMLFYGGWVAGSLCVELC